MGCGLSPARKRLDCVLAVERDSHLDDGALRDSTNIVRSESRAPSVRTSVS